MQKTFLIIGIVLAGLAVVLGAFGAHGLKKIATPEIVNSYQTGVQYQMYHALALLLLALLLYRMSGSIFHYSGFLFIGGTICFSGSIYLITSLKTMDRAIPKLIGILTPLGGLLFIVGWVLLLVGVIKDKA
jgi:uncharacterized membrane protein YgdD (TMEM256/DUF423 family)